MIKVAINGYGRIGRSILRAIYENNLHKQIKIIALNTIPCIETSAHLTKYDSIHGVFTEDVQHTENGIQINNDYIKCYNEKSLNQLPWHEDKIDIVFECSGKFNDGLLANQHIQAGAKKVLISAPA